MCGINGFSSKDINLLKIMMSKTKRRGPDGEGIFVNDDISLGHNRLSIIDLDKRSNQPYIYENLVLSFNGEIYNYKILKRELIDLGYKFQTSSDTEVLIKLFKEFSEDAFKKISGIFAISLWDKDEKKLYLIRDIVGIKPLYYKVVKGEIFFSSLIGPLKEIGNKSLNLSAVNYYANFGYNDNVETFFSGILKVLPGELITFQNKKIKKKKLLNYNFRENLSNQEIKVEINKIVEKQTVSDVPIALALSGGIDSNILLSNIHKKKLTTYNLSFSYLGNKNLDSVYASNRAKEYKTNHIEINVDDNEFINSIEQMSGITEEPIANVNSINNYILSKNIKEKVLLCGDGGDEIFTGYNKYRSIFFLSILNRLNFLKFLNLNSNFKIENFNRLFYSDSKDMFLSFSQQRLFNINKLLNNFKKIGSKEISFNHYNENFSDLNLSNIILADLDTWIQNEVLIRNDKIYMNEGIEVRVPYLDQDMIEKFLFLSNLRKINFFGKTKPLLRKIYKKELKTTMKQKKGFVSPFNFWINDEKNMKIVRYFFSKEYFKSDLMNYEEIQKILDQKNKNSYLIYSVISLITFLKINNF